MEFSIDREKALRLAKDLGIDVEFDSEMPGIFEKKTGKYFSLKEIFFVPSREEIKFDFLNYKVKSVSIPLQFQLDLENIDMSRKPKTMWGACRYKSYDKIDIA